MATRVFNSAATAEAYYRQGVVALGADRLEDAVFALRHAVELAPQMKSAWTDLGAVMEALGNPSEALRCYEHALPSRFHV